MNKRIAALKKSQEDEIARERDDIGRLVPDAPVSLQIPTKVVRGELQADLEDEFFGGFVESDHDEATIEQPGSKIARQAAPRKWAADRPSNGPHPYVMQAVRQAEQQVPEPTLERDRAEHLERLGERLALLAVPTDPNSGPSRSFARGILHEERAAFFGQHTERRVQALFTRRYKPSRALEEKRFPKLAKVNTKLVPKARGPKPDLRAELEPLVAAYDGPITACPPEKTTRMLNKRSRGRPPDGDRAMTGAERKRRHRIKLRIIAETSPPPSGDANVRTVSKHQRQFNPGRLDRGRDDRAKRKAAR